MTTILFTFLFALFLGVLLTPFVRRLGHKAGAVDLPGGRRVHTQPTPRIGGLALLLAFLLALAAARGLGTDVSATLHMDPEMAAFLAGLLVVSAVGLWDDFRPLGHKVKFLVQIAAASIAYAGGLKVATFAFFGTLWHLGWVPGYLATVFWFLLFINAVNLFDGLDGLAAGVCFFTAAVMAVFGIMGQQYLIALCFSALAGSLLGFLRYNFNPASIFMGDSGSYFLGYVMAGLGIMGSMKTQMGATVLIPLVALGVPVMDTILAPLRRFVRGKGMFQPDRKHLHHRLLDMGLSTRRVVYVIYGITCALCVLAVLAANFRNEFAGLLLIFLGVGAFLFMKKVGYLEYLSSEKFLGWFRDISDGVGLTRERRTFLDIEIEISRATTIGRVARESIRAFDFLHMDCAAFYMEDGLRMAPAKPGAEDRPRFERRQALPFQASVSLRHEPPEWTWCRFGQPERTELNPRTMLRIELPLMDKQGRNFGQLLVIKDLSRGELRPFTLRRIGRLSKTVARSLSRIAADRGPQNGQAAEQDQAAA